MNKLAIVYWSGTGNTETMANCIADGARESGAEVAMLPPGEFSAAARWAKELAPYGITVRVLKYCPQTGACLIYLYRAGWLRSILSEPSTRAFLAGQGYGADQSCQELLRQLSRRLCLEREFPHEIGVFLGYPLEDVVGFIRNRGRNYTCCGYWKAYGDPEAAQKRFDQYRRCTAACCEQFRKGTAITQLIAA